MIISELVKFKLKRTNQNSGLFSQNKIHHDVIVNFFNKNIIYWLDENTTFDKYIYLNRSFELQLIIKNKDNEEETIFLTDETKEIYNKIIDLFDSREYINRNNNNNIKFKNKTIYRFGPIIHNKKIQEIDFLIKLTTNEIENFLTSEEKNDKLFNEISFEIEDLNKIYEWHLNSKAIREIIFTETAFNGLLTEEKWSNYDDEFESVEIYIESFKKLFYDFQNFKKKPLRVQLAINLVFVKKSDNEEILEETIITVHSIIVIIFDNNWGISFANIKEDLVQKVIKKIDEPNLKESGFVFSRFSCIFARSNHTNHFVKPGKFILNKTLSQKNCLYNPENEDNLCLLYCIAEKLNVSINEILDKIKDLNIQFPIEIDNEIDFIRLEKRLNITINIILYTEDEYPYYPKRQTPFFEIDQKSHLNLLVIFDNENNSHFTLITDLSRLFYNENKFRGRMNVCPKCYCYISSFEKYSEHTNICFSSKSCINKETFKKISLPKDIILKYSSKNNENKIENYSIYDWESYFKIIEYEDFKKTFLENDIKNDEIKLLYDNVKEDRKNIKFVKNKDLVQNGINLFNHERASVSLLNIGTMNNLVHIQKEINENNENFNNRIKEVFTEPILKFIDECEKKKKQREITISNLRKRKEINNKCNQEILRRLVDKNNNYSCNICSKEMKVNDFIPFYSSIGKLTDIICYSCYCNIDYVQDKYAFFAHNAKNYDNKLILETMLNLLKNIGTIKTQTIPNSIEKIRKFEFELTYETNVKYKLNCSCGHQNNIVNLDRAYCKKCNVSLVYLKNFLDDESLVKIIDTSKKCTICLADSYEFISVALATGVKNLLDLNDGYCNKCKKNSSILDTKFYEKKFNIYTKNLCSNCQQYKINKKIDLTKIKNVSKNFPIEDLPFLLRKGVFPYEWFTSLEKLKVTELPDFEEFFSLLTGSNISRKDYAFAKRLFAYFKNKNNDFNMCEYLKIYNNLDVCLTADILDYFQNVMFEKYGLDPLHFLGLPQYAWASMLKMRRESEKNIELLSSEEAYIRCEDSIRGGISIVPGTIAESNNCYYYDNIKNKVILLNEEEAIEKKIYNKNLKKSYILYCDANNLYGNAMIMKLPYSDHQFFDEKNEEFEKMSKIDYYENIDVDGEYYYNLEIDAYLPEEHHEKFKDYAFMPNKRNITFDELSDLHKEILIKENKKFVSVSKLICSLDPVKKYKISLKLLKLYLENGAVVTKIHSVYRAKQDYILKEFIDFNTEMRKNAKNDFEKDLFKLMNNAIYGKTMESVRNKKELKLVDDFKKLEKVNRNGNYSQFKIISNELVFFVFDKNNIKLNKPIFIGSAVLDYSKFIMLKYFLHLKNKYGNKINVLMSDTDSFIFKVETEDIYQDIKKDKQIYDFSNYENFDNIDFDRNFNKKVLGKFKDETGGKPIRKFIGLRSKCYTYKTDDVIKKTAKGTPKINIKNDLTLEDFEKCINEICSKDVQTLSLVSNNYKMSTKMQYKKSLSPFDDKYYMDNKNGKIEKIPYGYKQGN